MIWSSKSDIPYRTSSIWRSNELYERTTCIICWSIDIATGKKFPIFGLNFARTLIINTKINTVYLPEIHQLSVIAYHRASESFRFGILKLFGNDQEDLLNRSWREPRWPGIATWTEEWPEKTMDEVYNVGTRSLYRDLIRVRSFIFPNPRFQRDLKRMKELFCGRSRVARQI